MAFVMFCVALRAYDVVVVAAKEDFSEADSIATRKHQRTPEPFIWDVVLTAERKA
jgi:hypothetical protein